MPTDPTPEQVYAALPSIGGRLSIMTREVLRLMESCLPGALDFTNQKLNLANAPRGPIPAPAFYRMSGEKLGEDDINGILVGVSSPYRNLGASQWEGDSHFSLFSLDKPIGANPIRIQDHMDRVHIMGGILVCTRGAWTDPAGRPMWYVARPLDVAMLPGQYQDWSGWGFTWNIKMAPISNAWLPDN